MLDALTVDKPLSPAGGAVMDLFDDPVERRYLAIVQLAAALAATTDWQTFLSRVACALSPRRPPAARVWGMSPEGPYELGRTPLAAEFPQRNPLDIRRAASLDNGPLSPNGETLLMGLPCAGSPTVVLELDAADDVDLELVWRSQPLLGAHAARLSITAPSASLVAADAADPVEASVLHRFAAQARRLLEHDRLSIYLQTPDCRALERFAVETSSALPDEAVVVPFGDVGLRQVLLTNAAVVSEDLASDPRIVGREDRVIAAAGFRGLLSVPLRLDGRSFGLLNFVSRTAGFYQQADVAIAEQLADQVSPFIAHLRGERRRHACTRRIAADEERARLSRELHDVLNAPLADLHRRAQRLATGATQGDIDPAEARRLADDLHLATADARRALAELPSYALERMSLECAIEAQLAAIRENHGVGTSLSVGGHPDSLPLVVRNAVYRTAREAIANVRDHAGARRVDVELKVDSDLELTVADDGVGFDPSDPAHNRAPGIRSMRDRADAFGGRLMIQSGPEQGTTILFELPDAYSAPSPQRDGCGDSSSRLEPAGPTLRVLVFESHPLLLAGIAKALDHHNDIRIVRQVACADEVHRQVMRLRPDVLLIDADADPEAARALVRETSRSTPSVAIIVMSDHGAASADELRDHGASGVIHKCMSPDRFGPAIRAAMAGTDSPALGAPAQPSGTAGRLTTRERAILGLVASGHTNAEIGESLNFSTKTIERQVATVVDKLSARNRAHAAAMAIANGIVRLEGGGTPN